MVFFCTGAGTHNFIFLSKGFWRPFERRVLDHIQPPFTLQNVQCIIEKILAFFGSAPLCAPPHSRKTGKNCVVDMKRRPHWPRERHVVYLEAFSWPQTCRPRHTALIHCVAGKMVLIIALSDGSWGRPYPPPADPLCALWGSPRPMPPPALPPAPHSSLGGASPGCHGSPAAHPPGLIRLMRNPRLPPSRNCTRGKWPKPAQKKNSTIAGKSALENQIRKGSLSIQKAPSHYLIMV